VSLVRALRCGIRGRDWAGAVSARQPSRRIRPASGEYARGRLNSRAGSGMGNRTVGATVKGNAMRLAAPWWTNTIWSVPWVAGAALFMSAGIEAIFVDLPGSQVVLVLQSLVLVAVFTFLAIRAHRRGVETNDDGLTARRVFRTRRHRWETIEGFGLEDTPGDDECPPGIFLEMVLRGEEKKEDRTVRLPLGGGFQGDGRARRLRGFAKQLNGELRRHTGHAR
jgi:hypothetical protein